MADLLLWGYCFNFKELKGSYFKIFRFEIYSAGTSSMQAHSYTKMGKIFNLFIDMWYISSNVNLHAGETNSLKPPFPMCLYWYFLQVISAFMLVSIVFIPIGVASLYASRDVRLTKILIFCIFFFKFTFEFLVALLLMGKYLSNRLLKLLNDMKLTVYLSALEMIRSNTFKALEINCVTYQ